MVFLLPQAVDRAAERFPEREAVRFHNQSLSYAQLATRSSQLARVLVEEGVKRGDRVGIYMNKSLECAIAIYGIMKAGAAYVPLDPAAPLSRLIYVIQDCGIRYLVSQPQPGRKGAGQLLNKLASSEAGGLLERVIGLTDDAKLPFRSLSWSEVYQTPIKTTLEVGAIEQDLAYILYTSGSTGDPKGIMHTHRSGLSFAQWAKETYQLRHEDRISNHAPLHFDLSTFDFFAAALAGATTVMIPEAYKKLPASLSKLMANEQLSVWYSVPFALIQLLLRGGLPTCDLSALRWVLFAGEAFPTKYLRQLMQQLPHARFSNLYGPTETNVCTYYHVPPFSELPDEPLPIGKVCENAEALVVDEKNQPVRVGEVGELLIRGPLVMRGYWGKANLSHQNQEKLFYRRPVFAHYEDRFYRTGDLVQQVIDSPDQPAGYFRFLGRKDRQIKIRGYRVELDEIETALLSHPKVEEAAVFAIPDGQGSQQIEAVVTLKEEANEFSKKTHKVGALGTSGRVCEPLSALCSSELKKHISASLPPYAIPTKMTIVESLPRTSTGKIDRQTIKKQAISCL